MTKAQSENQAPVELISRTSSSSRNSSSSNSNNNNRSSSSSSSNNNNINRSSKFSWRRFSVVVFLAAALLSPAGSDSAAVAFRPLPSPPTLMPMPIPIPSPFTEEEEDVALEHAGLEAVPLAVMANLGGPATAAAAEIVAPTIIATTTARERRSIESSTVSSSVSARRRGRLVFTETLSDHANSSRALLDPCGAGPFLRRSLPAGQEEEPRVLDVGGREAPVAAMAAAVLADLRQVEAALPAHECEGQALESLLPFPDLSSSADEGLSASKLGEVYWHLHSLSAHFLFMQQDWRDGESCSRYPERIISKVLRIRDSLRLSQCSLLVPIDPDPMSPPYPTPSMQARHSTEASRDIFHYRGCSARAARDCILTRRAKRLLTLFREKLRSAASSSSVPTPL